MSLESDLLTPDRVTEPPAAPPAEPAPPAVEPEPAPLNLEDDAAVDAALAEGAITPPDGEALIPSGNVGKVARAYRQREKELKARLAEVEPKSAQAEQLAARVAELEQTVQQYRPYVDAYHAQPPVQSATPQKEPVPDTDAQSWAQRYDLYLPDGSGKLDLERAKDIIRETRSIAREEAQRAAQEAVQPLAAHTVAQASAAMLAVAKQTVLKNGARPDPDKLDLIWSRLDPSLTATREGAQQAYMAALGYSAGLSQPAAPPAAPQPTRGPNGQFVAAPPAGAPIPDPVPREPSGGLEGTPNSPLTAQEQRFLKQSGMSEADYLKSAATAPWLRR